MTHSAHRRRRFPRAPSPRAGPPPPFSSPSRLPIRGFNQKETHMKHPPHWKYALVVMLIAAFPLTAFGQSASATLRGTVYDESGNLFPTAEITATNLERGY